jgi:hypothetical protein
LIWLNLTAKKKKVIPKVSQIKKFLDYDSLAYILMFAGAKKSQGSSGIEIHLQKYSHNSIARFCIALKEKLQIMAKPSCEVREGKKYWSVYISSVSSNIIQAEIKKRLLPHLRDRFPPLDDLFGLPGTSTFKKKQGLSSRVDVDEDGLPALLKNSSLEWYEANKKAAYRNSCD